MALGAINGSIFSSPFGLWSHTIFERPVIHGVIFMSIYLGLFLGFASHTQTILCWFLWEERTSNHPYLSQTTSSQIVVSPWPFRPTVGQSPILLDLKSRVKSWVAREFDAFQLSV